MQLQRFVFQAMACENELRLYAPDEQRGTDVANHAIAEVRRIEHRYSRYRDDSVISLINREAGKSAVTIDSETASLLNLADSCFCASGGLFDITSGVLRRAWNFRNGQLPDAQSVTAILPLIGWQKVERNGMQVRLTQEGMEIDFGGIGKEYAADRAAQILMDAGIRSGLVNLGGDIRIIGPHPNGAPWQIYIAHPRLEGATIATLELMQGALTTSGDYLRFIDVDGRRYSHILNPQTGWPVSHWQSSTVVAPLCAAAGSLSTIAMLLEARAPQFLEKRNVGYLLVDPMGKMLRTSSSGISLAL